MAVLPFVPGSGVVSKLLLGLLVDRLRLLLRHRREPHRRDHRLVVEPDLGHDDRDADGDLPDLRRRRLDGRRLPADGAVRRRRWSASPRRTPARRRRISRPATWSARRRASSRSASSSACVTADRSVVGLTIRVLDHAARTHLIGSDRFPAPQATLMATLIKGLLARQPRLAVRARRRVARGDDGAVRGEVALVRRRRLPAAVDDVADLRRRRRQGGRRSPGARGAPPPAARTRAKSPSSAPATSSRPASSRAARSPASSSRC